MIQSLFPNQKNQITQWQNIAALGVVSYTVYLYSIDDIISCNNVLLTYFAFDIFFAKPEAALHHTFCVMMMSCNLPYGYNHEDSIFILRPLIKTEVSTIFLLLKLLYEQNASAKQNSIVKTVFAMNDVAFVTTFMKTRIWDLTFDVMLNPEIYQKNQKYLKDSTMRNLHFYVGFYGLYAMNLYWTSIIFRKLFNDLIVKTRFAWINTMTNAERVLPWTLILCVVPLLRVPLLQSNINILYDFAGATVLAITSYIYHARKRDILNSGKDALIANNIFVNGLKDADNDVSTEFLFNTGAIHLKSFLSLIAINSNRGWTSFMLHFSCFLGSDIYSDQQTQITYTAEPNRHMKILFAFTMVPTMYDLVHIIAAVDDRVTQTQIIMTVIALIAIIKVKPLYDLNQILVHLVVVLQTWSIVSK